MSPLPLNVGTIGGASALSIIFRTRSSVPFLLRAELARASFVLADDNGVLAINRTDYSGVLDEQGVLRPSTTYSLTIQAGFNGGFNLRFTTGESPSDKISCTPQLSHASHAPYENGDVVRATELRIGNTHSYDVPIEVKVWLQVPNGTRHAAWDFGSDGSIVFPFFHGRNLAPFDLFEVTEAVERGEYELGCRLIDPTTGRQLHESIAVFRVR